MANADGLRARMSGFRILDLDMAAPDTKHADATEAIWSRYWQDPVALRAAVEAARMHIKTQAARPGMRLSRGPVAWSGDGRFERLAFHPRWASPGGWWMQC